MRRQLDLQLRGLRTQIGPHPHNGWIWTIRRAVGMTTGNLAQRMAISQARASRLERNERDGSIRLSTLRRVAEALNCQLVYAFVPIEPLEGMVRRQAHDKAAEVIAREKDNLEPGQQVLAAELLSAQQEALTIELIDTPALWRPSAASRPGSPPTNRPEP